MTDRRINSVKRTAIMDCLYRSKEHPSAEMLFNDMKELYPEISFGTIYRNLNVLVEDGSVIKVCNVDGKDRYDARTYSHPHFICRNCHRVLDVDYSVEDTSLLKEASRNNGFKAESIKMEFTGLCDKCSR